MNQACRITLRALRGEPLEDAALRDIVVATAHAIAERQGIRVGEIETEPDRITITLGAGRIESIGFAAELRRVTTRWFRNKYGEETLWGEVEREDPHAGEEWKLT